jgi:demethylmenaquinone methyltransferase/2-methoxy-6-polyprenyl-1,4-benzoquinol methylase
VAAVTGLRGRIATPQGKAPYVRRLFSTIADRYDLITVLLSYGQDRRWKQRLVALAGPLAGRRALDLACGTGDIAFLLADAGAHVTGLDLTPRMLELAAAKQGGSARRVAFVAGDMMALPLPGGRFDVVTTGYGLRNVPDLGRTLDEIRRVLAPGGVFLSLDFNRPAPAPVRAAYHAYLTLVGSVLGWVLHGDPDTYRYIAESIRTYPGAPRVVRQLQDAGFQEAEWRPVLGGLMAIHVARAPAWPRIQDPAVSVRRDGLPVRPGGV